jgi:hypothetical protein
VEEDLDNRARGPIARSPICSGCPLTAGRSWNSGFALVLAGVALAAVICVGSARGNGDPASHYLYAVPLFYSFQTNISESARDAVSTTIGRSANAGYPIRVALIERPADLGDVTRLWGKPTQYANLLAEEISYRYRGPLLVVMPGGIGFTRKNGDPRAEQRALQSLRVVHGQDGLALTAIQSISLLAAGAGHRITPASIAPSASSDDSGLVIVTGGLAAAFLAAVAAAIVLHRRRLRPQP